MNNKLSLALFLVAGLSFSSITQTASWLPSCNKTTLSIGAAGLASTFALMYHYSDNDNARSKYIDKIKLHHIVGLWKLAGVAGLGYSAIQVFKGEKAHSTEKIFAQILALMAVLPLDFQENQKNWKDEDEYEDEYPARDADVVEDDDADARGVWPTKVKNNR